MTDKIQLIPNKEITFGKKLGEGGFGVVYQGKWEGEDVAIKRLKMTNLSPQEKQEFTRETSAMARLNSPRVIHLFGICIEPGHYAMVMALMPKGDLYGLLKNKQKNFPWTKRWELAIDVGIGLRYLHGKNILHRDLKSMNILLDANLRAKITDFGLAKLRLHSKSIYTEGLKGSLAWMAPELFGRRPKLTDKSDVYAYAMVLWEIASRSIPFSDAQDPTLISVWVREGEREDIPKNCPLAYAKVIQLCWDQDPNKRPFASDALKQLRMAQPKREEAPLSNRNVSSTVSTSTESSSSTSRELSSFQLSKEEKKPPEDFGFNSGDFNQVSGKELGRGKIEPEGFLSEQKTSSVSGKDRVLSSYRGTISKPIKSTKQFKNTQMSSVVQKDMNVWSKWGCLQTIRLQGNVSARQLVSLPKGRFAISGDDNCIEIWSLKGGKKIKALMPGFGTLGFSFFNRAVLKSGNGITALERLPNNQLISYCKSDTCIRVWNIETGKAVNKLTQTAAVSGFCVLRDGSLMSGDSSGEFKVWDLSKGTVARTIKQHVNGANMAISAFAVSYKQGYLVSTTPHFHVIDVRSLVSGKKIRTLKGHQGIIKALTILPNGQLASGSEDKMIKIWDLDKGVCVRTLKGHKGAVRSLVVLPKGEFASGSVEGTVKIWNTSSGKCLRTLDLKLGQITGLDITAEGHLLCVSSNNKVYVLGPAKK